MVRCVYIEAHGITPSITNYTNNYQELPVHTLPPNMVASHKAVIGKPTMKSKSKGLIINKNNLNIINSDNSNESDGKMSMLILLTNNDPINLVLHFDSEDLGTDNITVKNSTLFNKSNMETLASFMLNFPKKTLHDLKKDYLRFNSKSFDSLKKKDSFTDDELIKIFKTEYLVFQKYLESGIDLMNMDNYRILSKSRLQNKPIAEKTFRNFLHCLILDSLYSFELLSKLLTEDEISQREVLKEMFLDIINAQLKDSLGSETIGFVYTSKMICDRISDKFSEPVKILFNTCRVLLNNRNTLLPTISKKSRDSNNLNFERVKKIYESFNYSKLNKNTLPNITYLRKKYPHFTNTQINNLHYQIIQGNNTNTLSVNSLNISTRGGKKKVTVKKVGVYRSKGGYYYRRYKNGKVKRISKEIYKNIK